MVRTPRLRALSLVLFLGVAPVACVETSDEVVLAPSAGVNIGCAEPPAGQLRGLVYTLPRETRRLPAFDALHPVGALCVEHLAVTERNGFPGFPGLGSRYQWFGVDYQGAFVVGQPGTFHFRLTSDDGSRVYIDGALVVDNDGYHPVRTREGAVSLGAGPHVLRVPYWQGPGPLALILEVARPGEGFEVFHVARPL